MEERTHILGLTGDELRSRLASLGLAGYRADQVRQWIFARRVAEFGQMSNLSKADRARLAELFTIAQGQVVRHEEADDGVHKLLLRWSDEAGDTSEAVMIPAEDRDAARRTACISTQVGCPVGCRFCASGVGGLTRNLTAGQIVEQAWQLARLTLAPQDRLTNVVIMGIGEPLANYDATVKAIRLINADDGLNIGARKITLSTVGLPAMIRKLAGEDLQITLAISLHAPNQQLRAELVPWAARFKLSDVLAAAREYFDHTGREITLEYVMIEAVNTLVEHADELAEIARSMRCNVNLIYYNPVAGMGRDGRDYERASKATATAFRDRLARRGVNVHIRPSRGLSIDAACGQLRHREG